jgi:hypothetical protein
MSWLANTTGELATAETGREDMQDPFGKEESKHLRADHEAHSHGDCAWKTLYREEHTNGKWGGK